MTPENILERLRAARTPEERALVNVAIVLDGQSDTLRRGVQAAAVPHWFDGQILAALLEISPTSAEPLYGGLTALSFVEPFHAREAHNVHDLTRRALLKQLIGEDQALYLALSQRAARCFENRDHPTEKIEAIYHDLLSASDEAIDRLWALYAEWAGQEAAGWLQSLAAALDEHLEANRLTDNPRAMALYLTALIGLDYRPLAQTASRLEKALEYYRATKDEFYQGGVLGSLGEIRALQGKAKDARACYEEQLDLRRRLAQANPTELSHRQNLFTGYLRLGDFEVDQKNPEAAMNFYQAAQVIARELAEKDPQNVRCQTALAYSHERMGRAQINADRAGEALRSYETALDITKVVVDKDPQNPTRQRELLVSFFHLGDVLFKLNLYDRALEYYRAALPIAEERAATNARNTSNQRDLTATHNNIGDVLRAQGRYQEALDCYTTAHGIRETLVALDPENAQWQEDIAETRKNIDKARELLKSSAAGGEA